MNRLLTAALLTCAATTAALAEQPARIAWWPTVEQGRAEAARTGKPIFLLSAAPQCRNVPGVW